MTQEHDEFSRQHPGLDRALREQVRAPKMDAAFRRQVFARIEAQRATLLREAAAPQVVRSLLRADLVLQLVNLAAIAVCGALVFAVFGPRLGAMLARGEALSMSPALHQDWGLAVSVGLGLGALVYGLQRARLLGWMRTLVT